MAYTVFSPGPLLEKIWTAKPDLSLLWLEQWRATKRWHPHGVK